jgi:threonine aldolase
MSIDFRSDTVTKPTAAMREVMASAPLGDDVFAEDPSINDLENLAAGLFGMESAIFCPSGTMTNQVAIKCHTQPGDEVICDADAHIYQYEGGGIAFNAGCSVKLIQGNRGRITAAQVQASIQPDDVHRPVSRLVCLENTANRGGGSCYDFQEIQAIRQVCDSAGLSLHLDGARLFNAIIAHQKDDRWRMADGGNTPGAPSFINQQLKAYGSAFHSISICLSKGLGAPVGSLLLGNATFIRKARRVRKVFGGGMRQAGMLAAAGMYALEHHVERLAEDHFHAQLIAEALRKKDFIADLLPVETNIIIAEVRVPWTPALFVETMRQKGVLLFAFSPTRFRMVTHLDLNREMVDQTIDIIEKL